MSYKSNSEGTTTEHTKKTHTNYIETWYCAYTVKSVHNILRTERIEFVSLTKNEWKKAHEKQQQQQRRETNANDEKYEHVSYNRNVNDKRWRATENDIAAKPSSVQWTHD